MSLASVAATRGQLLRLSAVLLAAALPVLVAPGAIARAAGLYSLTTPGREYLAAGHPVLVYGLVPMVALSATLLLLAPGLFLALHFRRARTLADWVLTGFLCSLVGVSVVSGVLQSIVGDRLRGSTYALVLLGLAVLAALSLRGRVAAGVVPWPLATPNDRRDAVVLLVGWLAAATFLAPKLLWDSFNGDGAHAYESSRLLLRHALPFWPRDAGPVSGFPGMTSMLYAFPNAWFLRLFGELEYAVRLPLLLYVPVLGCGIRVLGESGLETVPRATSAMRTGLLASLTAYLLAMAFSASYNPYSADIALPATQDTLLMIVFVGALVASIRRDWWGLGLGVLLTYLSLPSGLILVGLWLVARALTQRPVPWRDLVGMGGMLAGVFVLSALAPRLLVALGAPPPGGEYGLIGILKYFAFLQFTDVTRVLYVAIPAGIFPVLLLPFWRSHDPVGRALTLVTLGYFLFFFVQAHISLHHLVPAMVLPLAVAWRTLSVGSGAPSLAAWWPRLGVVAVFLAFPWGRLAIHRDGRDVGTSVTVTIPGYAASDADVLRASTVLDRLFPYDWDPDVPASYGGSPLVWNHYARHAATPEPGANYIVQPSAAAAPVGWHLVGADSTGASVWARDLAWLARDRSRRPATPPGAVLLRVPRGILFHGVPLQGGPRIIDVAATLRAWGLDIDPILERLGARRGS